MLHELLKAGADVEKTDISGNTARSIAAESSNPAMSELLKASGPEGWKTAMEQGVRNEGRQSGPKKAWFEIDVSVQREGNTVGEEGQKCDAESICFNPFATFVPSDSAGGRTWARSYLPSSACSQASYAVTASSDCGCNPNEGPPGTLLLVSSIRIFNNQNHAKVHEKLGEVLHPLKRGYCFGASIDDAMRWRIEEQLDCTCKRCPWCTQIKGQCILVAPSDQQGLESTLNELQGPKQFQLQLGPGKKGKHVVLHMS